MAIPFNKIPLNWRLPLFFAEIDPSQANNATTEQRTLIVAQKSTGTATANIAFQCSSLGSANAKTGPDSMCARAFGKYIANDNTGETWILPVVDDPSAVAATGEFKFTHVATANGVLSLYVAGQLVSLPVASTQTLPQLATALVAAVNAIPTMPVTAAVDGADNTQVNLVAVNAGLIGNDFDLQVNFYGSQNGEVTPAGLTFTITPFSGGLLNPLFTTAFANLVDTAFDFIVFPYTDAASLNAIQAFLNDTTGRWSFDRQVYGQYMTAYRGTVGALQTFGLTRNDPHGSVMGFNGIPNPLDEVAAAFYGAIAPAVRNDPGRPVQFLNVNGLLPPPMASQFSDVDRNTLLYSGISTFTVNGAGQIATENVITTYQLDQAGQPDNSFLEIETLFLLAFVLRGLRTLVTSKYPRMKLARDGTRFAPGSAIVTPSVVKFDIIAFYRQLEYEGFVQDSAVFAQTIIVEINAQNPNRLDCLWPGVLIGQLRMFALLAQFRLQPSQ